jgi:hypothetical protein
MAKKVTETEPEPEPGTEPESESETGSESESETGTEMDTEGLLARQFGASHGACDVQGHPRGQRLERLTIVDPWQRVAEPFAEVALTLGLPAALRVSFVANNAVRVLTREESGRYALTD